VKYAIFVAHPDDEFLWFSAAIDWIKARGDSVLVVCVTNADNSVRKAEFLESCEKLGVAGRIFSLKDPGGGSLVIGLPTLVKRVLREENVSGIITHAPHGDERAHIHHIQLFYVCDFLSRTQGKTFGVSSTMPVAWDDENFYSISNPGFRRITRLMLRDLRNLSWEFYGIMILKIMNFLKPRKFNVFSLASISIKKQFVQIYKSQQLEGHYAAVDSSNEYLYLSE
jgi:LmbE family N-acetylglucosaminyl deacetylase